MAATVDHHAGVVRAGSASWPFTLDLRNGTASLDLGDRRLTVRALVWREKLALARFAHLGAAFAQRQFVTLALSGEAPPADVEVAEALAELALWLNDPDGQPGLPLDPRVLASATLGVCRAAGLRPSDLDDRPAAEIELLWQASAPQPVAETPPGITRAAAEPPGMIRIQIQPDPAPETAADEPGPALPTTRPVAATPQGEPPPPHATLLATNDIAGASDPAPEPQDAAEQRIPDSGLLTHGVTPEVAHTADTSRPAARAPSIPIMRVNAPVQHEAHQGGPRRSGGFRVTYLDALPLPGPVQPIAPSLEVITTEPAVAPAMPLSITRAATMQERNEVPARSAASRDIALPQVMPQEDSSPTAEWYDAVIDELAERLEQAAAELGIDVED